MSNLLDALKTYAGMFNDLNSQQLKDCLDENFCYSSQMVFEEIRGKSKYAAYIDAKLKAIKESGSKVFAELAISGHGDEPNCLVMSQGDIENLISTLFVEVREGVIIRADMCFLPSPLNVRRTGIYPKVSG